MTYPGVKNGAGIYQRIINNMPPHEVYIEGFCGSGAVLRNKRPALQNMAFDLSQEALDLTAKLAGDRSDISFYNECIISKLYEMAMGPTIEPATLIYLDVPYVTSTRVKQNVYEHEMSDGEHYRMISHAKMLGCMVMISGYRNTIYDEMLKRWRRIDYMAQTRGGMKAESLWMNFTEPTELHDYSFLGDNFRERERLKKKKQRWLNKLEKMDRPERLMLMDAIAEMNN